MTQFNIVDRTAKQRPQIKIVGVKKDPIVSMDSRVFLDRELSLSAKGIYGTIVASIHNELKFNPLPYWAEVKELENFDYIRLVETENGFIIQIV